MKPNDIPLQAGQPNQIESHPPPTLRSQLITAVRLFIIAGVLFLALWFVDRMVIS
jgi:hypothetical protein